MVFLQCYVFVEYRAFLYIVVQSLGAITGAGILQGVTANGTNDALGTASPGTGVSLGQVFGIELLITFVLVFTVFATCDSLRSGFDGSGPLAIGLSISMCHFWAVRSRSIALTCRSLSRSPMLLLRSYSGAFCERSPTSSLSSSSTDIFRVA